MNLPLGSLSDPSSIIVAKTNAVTTNSEFSVQQPTYEMHVWSHLKPSNLCISYDYPSHLQHPPAYRVGSRDLERLKISSKTTQLRSDGTTILTGCPSLRHTGLADALHHHGGSTRARLWAGYHTEGRCLRHHHWKVLLWAKVVLYS